MRKITMNLAIALSLLIVALLTKKYQKTHAVPDRAS